MEISTSELRTIVPDALAGLDENAITRLAGYLKLVEEYRGTLNLTGYQGTQDLARGLVGESLRLNKLGILAPGHQVIDLGSGNGSPVVPLAIACPEVQFTAVDSRLKRGSFLQRVCAVLQLTNLSVRIERAEATAVAFPSHFDCAVSRGFAKPEAYLEIAAGFVKPSGTILGYCGDSTQAVVDAVSQLEQTNLRFEEYQGLTGTCHTYSVSNKP